MYLPLLHTELTVLSLLVVKLLINSAHVDSICELLLLNLAHLCLIVIVNLFLQLSVDQILHLTLTVDQLDRDFLILFRTEMSFSWLLDILLLNLLLKSIHLDLLVEDLTNSLLLLLAFHIGSHLETAIFLFKILKFSLVFDLSLLRSHKVHFKSFPGVANHTISVLHIIHRWSVKHSLMLLGPEWSILNELIEESFLLLILKFQLVLPYLVLKNV